MTPTPAVENGKVQFENVFFKYNTEAEDYVLKNVSLTVLAGETVAIIGATGAAKSTLVQLIPRLYDVTKGQVLIDDTDILDYALQNLRSQIHLVL